MNTPRGYEREKSRKKGGFFYILFSGEKVRIKYKWKQESYWKEAEMGEKSIIIWVKNN